MKSAKTKKPPKLFRLRTQRLLFTFPRCNVHPSVVVQRAVKGLAKLKWIIVSREKHGDEGLHLHGVIYFKTIYETRRADCLDFLAGKHGNYKPIRGKISNAVKYVIKDGDYVQHGVEAKIIIEAEKTKLGYSWSLLQRSIKEGKTFEELWDDERSASMVLRYHKTTKWGIAYCQKRRLSVRSVDWKIIDVKRLSGKSRMIAGWLNMNVRKKRTFKQAQLYISSVPGKGKTHLIQALRRIISVYNLPKSKNHDLWSDGMYDIAVLDEYKGMKNVSELNEFLQGSVMDLDQKYAGVRKQQNVPAIILSNYTLRQLFEKGRIDEMELLALKSRLTEVNIKDYEPRIDIFPISSPEKCLDQVFIDSSPDLPIVKKRKTDTLSCLPCDFFDKYV